MADDLSKLDLYLLFGVDENASEVAIKKAFRQKALSCHPDKNPDDPNASREFQKCQRAAEILLDPDARQAYDRVLRSRKERLSRSRELDGTRKKFKDELEAREKSSRDSKTEELDQALKLAQEIERLRREGCKQLEKENEELQRQIREQTGPSVETKSGEEDETRVKVGWKNAPSTVDADRVRRLFERFGQINEFIVSSKGKSALIVYKDPAAIISMSSSPLIAGFTIEIIGRLPVGAHVNRQAKRGDEYEQMVLQKLMQKAAEQANKTQ